jgi:hypothetical protein
MRPTEAEIDRKAHRSERPRETRRRSASFLGRIRQVTAAAWLLSLTVAPLFGCASSAVSVIQAEDPTMTTASLVVRVYGTSRQQREETLLAAPVTTRLVRYRGRQTEEVRVSTDPTWAISDLEPGDYGVSVVERKDPLQIPTTFLVRLRAGETVAVDLVGDPSPVARAVRRTLEMVVGTAVLAIIVYLDVTNGP